MRKLLQIIISFNYFSKNQVKVITYKFLRFFKVIIYIYIFSELCFTNFKKS